MRILFHKNNFQFLFFPPSHVPFSLSVQRLISPKSINYSHYPLSFLSHKFYFFSLFLFALFFFFFFFPSFFFPTKCQIKLILIQFFFFYAPPFFLLRFLLSRHHLCNNVFSHRLSLSPQIPLFLPISLIYPFPPFT